MGTLYLAAGIAHFVATRTYEAIMPDYLTAHHALVLISGVAEFAGGLGILLPYPKLNRAAAWGIILLLIAVSPANLWMLQHPERYANIPLWVLWARLPLQLVLIAWAWAYTRVPAAQRVGNQG
ncbi:DoxX family protein [Bryocella elongata]|nr:DoxX family protein [Bryocella elongata]